MNRILVDTNAILSNWQQTRADHAAVRDSLRSLVEAGHELCICAQNIYEFWVVATRPIDSNGLGLEPSEASGEIDRLLAAFTLVAEPSDMLSRWRAFCTANNVRGRRAHDARIAALMIAASIRDIFTNDAGDFSSWVDVHPVSPLSS